MATKYPSIRVEGGFLAADVLDSIADGSASGQAPRDFGFPDRTSLLDQISAAWSDARSYWSAFERRAAQLKDGETGTTFTRNQWMVPLLGVLGFEHITLQEKSSEVDGVTYAISHRAGSEPDSPPIHIVGAGQSLDKRSESGRPRLAPHSLLQEYLNRTEHVWVYGLSEQEIQYILDPADLYGDDFPGETFRVLKESEMRDFNQFRTKMRILDSWKKLGWS
jgi:hypothetical protein